MSNVYVYIRETYDQEAEAQKEKAINNGAHVMEFENFTEFMKWKLKIGS